LSLLGTGTKVECPMVILQLHLGPEQRHLMAIHGLPDLPGRPLLFQKATTGLRLLIQTHHVGNHVGDLLVGQPLPVAPGRH
jgi:hypothetical protein